MRNLRARLGESVRASLRRHPSSSSINHININARARRVGNRSVVQCGLTFSIVFKARTRQHRPFRTHESSMVSHTPPPPPPPHGESHTVSHTPRTRRDAHEPNGATIDYLIAHFSSRTRPRRRAANERTEPNRTEPNGTEPSRRRDASVEDARATTDRLDSIRRAAGIHPIHPSTVVGARRRRELLLDCSRLRSSERSDDESDAKARREDDQGEI